MPPVSSPSSDPSPATVELGFASLRQLADLLGSGEVSSAELVANALRRVQDLDRSGPGLASVLALDPRAEEVAARLDAEQAAGRRRSALHGLPVLIRDSLDTAGLATTAGSWALAGVPPPDRDATAVARLRSAGAVVVGKANLSEWSNLRGRASVSGWSGLGGQTRNPHVLDRSPGGSSSGSAVAVAAGLVPMALGAETDGSIVCPAALCGVVGCKPTVGLVPRTGAVPISSSQDSIGPLTRSVADAALVLSVLAGPDPADGASRPLPWAPAELATAADRALAGGHVLAGARLGVPRERFFGYSPKADVLVEAALARVGEAGATVVDPAPVPAGVELAISEEDELVVLHHELRVGMAAYLATRPEPAPRTLEDLIAFNRARADVELTLFGQEHFEVAAATRGLQDERYRRAWADNRLRARGGLDAVVAAGRLDALVVPTMGPAWCIDPVNGDAAGPAGYSVSAVAGYPVVTVPVGDVAGLPVGLCLLGRPWSEPTLLRLALAVEEVVSWSGRPPFRPTVAAP